MGPEGVSNRVPNGSSPEGPDLGSETPQMSDLRRELMKSMVSEHF